MFITVTAMDFDIDTLPESDTEEDIVESLLSCYSDSEDSDASSDDDLAGPIE